MNKLSNLRLFFIVYFIVKVIIDISVGRRIIGEQFGLFCIPPGMFYIIAIIANLVLFSLGLLLFHFLLEKRNWARIVLLIVGWLAVLDFISSFMLSSDAMKFLSHIDRDINWKTLIMADRITDFVGLIFWGYAIFILQFNDDVKKIFFPESKKEDPQITQN